MDKSNNTLRQLGLVLGLITAAAVLHLASIDWSARGSGEPYLALRIDNVWQAPYSSALVARYRDAYAQTRQAAPAMSELLVPTGWPSTWDEFARSAESYRGETTYGPYSRFGSRLAGAVLGLVLPSLLILSAFYRLSGIALGRRRPRLVGHEMHPVFVTLPSLAT